ncbi:MAG: GrpB family protein [Gemmatimonadetes bacterium]|nr:GrpB family protein [Gemmatimonadota bacterium]
MSAVTVVPYDPSWPDTFARLHALVWPAVQHASLRLEHVGSTAVPGLAAKPVIDATIVVASPRDIPFVVKGLVTIGYAHRGDLGVPGREAFRAPASSPLPAHHLYASPRHSVSLRNHLGLRDHLRAHPEVAAAYGALKVSLAQQFPDDIDRYIAGKTAFILDVLAQVGLSAEELQAVGEVNGASGSGGGGGAGAR